MPAIHTAAPGEPSPAPRVSLFYLYGLRILFLLMAIFLLSGVAPAMADPAPTHMSGVGLALLSALGLLSLLGVRYPLQMLPLMLFELAWKLLWLAFYGIPAWQAGNMDPAYASSLREIGIGVGMVIVVIPWAYVFRRYVMGRGDRWR